MPTALSGAPRPREPAPGTGPSRAAADVARGAWLAALVPAALVVWAGAGSLFALLEGRVDAARVALLGILPAALATCALLVVFTFSRRGGRDPALALGAAAWAATATLVLAIAGHLLHARGESFRAMFPPQLGGSTAGYALVALGLLAAPLAGGLLARAAGRGLDVGGASPWRPALGHAPGDDELGDPAFGPRAASLAGAFFEGLRMPGLLALDVALTFGGSLHARGERARLHFDVSPETLARALLTEDWHVDAPSDGDGIVASRGANENSPRVRIRWRRVHFPRCHASRTLVLAGPRAEVAQLRDLIEHRLAFLGICSWTGAARRVEARVNALAREADEVGTVEERAALLQALDDLEERLRLRPVLADEWTALAGWKVQQLRARLLQETFVAASERRALAPAPALRTELARLLDAGGLAATSRIVYVPYHLVPVATSLGEVEIAVNALTERIDAHESRALLRALEARGAYLRPEGTRPSFVPAPAATGALVGDARAAVRRGRRVRTSARLDAIDLVYVPFVARDGGWVNAVTGHGSPGLAEALARAPPAEA